MTSEIFADRVYAKRHAEDWKSAVDLAGGIWLERNMCDGSYIELIKTQLEENNAYAVIIPGLVLLHAEAGHGVYENSLMLITLDSPVSFGHEFNDPVEVMICFTSLGKNDHIKSMKRIAEMLIDDDFVEKTVAASSDSQLMAVVCEIESTTKD